MMMPDDWSHACNELSAELLADAGLTAPPFDMFALAEHLELGVAWDASLAGRGRLMRINGDTAIFLRPEERPERLQWATAHEIGEAVAWRAALRLGLDADQLDPRQRETLANQLANRLLLPEAWWATALRQEGQHIPRLKQHFTTASHELIAWRLLDGRDAKIVTIIDNGTVSRRRANFTLRCPAATSDEEHCWERARIDGDATCDRVRRLFPQDIPARCQAWAIHEADWQREIAITWAEIEMD